MKRNQVDIDVSKVLTEIKRQIGEWNRSYSAIMALEKLEVIEAAERYVALLEIHDILKLMDQKQLSLEELKDLLQQMKRNEKPVQSRLKFGSGNRQPKNPV